MVSSGGGSCGVTVDNIAYCWHDSGSVPVKGPGQRNAMTIRGPRLVQAVALAVLTACSDGPGGLGDEPLAEGLVVSDPVTPASLAAGARVTPALAGSAADEVAYVSLAPGTVPGGTLAAIRRVGDVGSIFTTVFGGGFDPVPVGAQAGDSVEVRVTDAGGATLFQARRAVADGRAPVVVRTSPPRGKTDVAVNASIVIVFSEPVAAGSLTSSSVQLFRGTARVAGTVSLLQGTGATIAFTPAAPLARNTAYRLEITRAVQDLDGDALSAAVSVSFATGQSSLGSPASIELTPSDTVVMTLSTYQLTATVRDGAGNVLIEQPIVWTSSNPAVTVSASGLLSASAIGASYVTATLNDLSAAVNVKVVAGPPASIEIVPAAVSVPALDTVYPEAIVRDAAGLRVECPSVTWTSGNPGVATVAVAYCGVGFVIGRSSGSATLTASIGALRATASVTVDPAVPVASVTVAPASVTMVPQGSKQLSVNVQDASGRQIGRPIVWASDNPAVAAVDATGRVSAASVGAAIVTATSGAVSDTATVTVTLPLILSAINAGWVNACGVAPNGSAYCWGSNYLGQLGNGTSTGLDRSDPVLVSGGLTFSSVTTWGAIDAALACGITTIGDAYCWGGNRYGELGIGTPGPETCSGGACSTVPVLVSGGLKFTELTAGTASTCGLTTGGSVYCWGLNAGGEFGDGTTTPSSIPVRGGGGMTFSALSGRSYFTCGLTSAGAAYCWGANGAGQLGNGSTTSSFTPAAVSGELTFASISAGYGFACGVTAAGVAYCWGDNGFGQLGTGTTGPSRVPVAVAGGLSFTSVSAGFGQACGLTTNGAWYCWGSPNNNPGTPSVPERVAPGLVFSTVSAGYVYSCGVTTTGAVYCLTGIRGAPPEGPLPTPP